MLSLLDGISIWFFMWLLFWGGYYFVLAKREINYIQNYIITSGYFLLASCIIVFIFQDYFIPIVRDFSLLPFTVLGAVFLLHIGIYYFFSKYFNVPKNIIKRYPEVQLLTMDYRYIVSRSFNILFQQTLIVLLAWILVVGGLDTNGIVLMFVILFIFAHVPLIDIIGMRVGSYFILACILAAWVFPLLVVRVNYGFVYSFALHQLFYIISSTSFWIYFGIKKPKKNIFKNNHLTA